MRRRRALLILVLGTVLLSLLGGAMPRLIEESIPPTTQSAQNNQEIVDNPANQGLEQLAELEVRGRAPKTGYSRSEFGSGWATVNGCSVRDIILYRDLENTVLEGECMVISGTLNDAYSGEVIQFSRSRSAEVQIDHVVALSDAWQKGAQQLTREQREQLANDPLELLAASGEENQAKSDADAASWLPTNKAFRCEYVTRQIAVKKKYTLWVTAAEKDAMRRVLSAC